MQVRILLWAELLFLKLGRRLSQQHWELLFFLIVPCPHLSLQVLVTRLRAFAALLVALLVPVLALGSQSLPDLGLLFQKQLLGDLFLMTLLAAPQVFSPVHYSNVPHLESLELQPSPGNPLLLRVSLVALHSPHW